MKKMIIIIITTTTKKMKWKKKENERLKEEDGKKICPCSVLFVRFSFCELIILWMLYLL